MAASMQERVKRWEQFYRRENKRPLLGFFYNDEYPLRRYRASRGLPMKRALRPDDFCVEDYLADYDALFEEHERFPGEAIYAASAFWGIPWIEASLGAEIIADADTGSIYAETPDWFGGPDDVIVFDPNGAWPRKCREFLEKLAEHSGGRYPLASTRLRGISDLLALLYGNDRFLFALLEEPEKALAAAEKLTDFIRDFARHQLEFIPDFYGGIGSFYYHNWAPRGTVWLQEDAAALLNPDLFETFILPGVRRLSEELPGVIMHQHPVGFLPMEYYLSLPFQAIELHVDTGGPSVEQLFPVHHKLLQHHPLIVWGELRADDIAFMFENHRVEGLALMVKSTSAEEAARLYERFVGSECGD